MESGEVGSLPPHQALDEHLIVDEFLVDPLRSEMLAAALNTGLIDAISDREPVAMETLAAGSRMDRPGLSFMIGTLVASEVLQREPGSEDRSSSSLTQPSDRLRLTSRFRRALRFRDLLEVKLDLARLVGEDFQRRLPAFLEGGETFFRQSRLFDLFDYSRCFDVTPENCMATWRWVRLTTVLTRYEASAVNHLVDFASHRRWLDLGGNSGELAVQILDRNPHLTATVFDLPVVCEVGRRHVANHPHRDAVTFVAGDLRAGELPGGYDIVTCKSLLHDWPEPDVLRMLTEARRALVPGGKLVIFEREGCVAVEDRLQFGMLPLLMFFRSYRSSDVYRAMLQKTGFTDVKLQRVMLDWPFMVLTAVNPVS